MELELKTDHDLEFQTKKSIPLPATPPTSGITGKIWNFTKRVGIILLIAGLSYGAFNFFTAYVIQSVHVVGQSMSPTLHDNGNYVLNRWVYHVRDPKPSEIVVLRDPEDNCFAIKRIVAKQGDTVLVKSGHLFVNGKELIEPYLPDGTSTFTGPRVNEQMWICGINQYFVLGDNRNNSADSRSYGTVPRQSILGMVTP